MQEQFFRSSRPEGNYMVTKMRESPRQESPFNPWMHCNAEESRKAHALYIALRQVEAAHPDHGQRSFEDVWCQLDLIALSDIHTMLHAQKLGLLEFQLPSDQPRQCPPAPKSCRMLTCRITTKGLRFLTDYEALVFRHLSEVSLPASSSS